MPEAATFVTFHIEHLIPLAHGGNELFDNLAFACPRCNCYKGTNLSAVDPSSRAVVSVFDPRNQLWDEHFTVVDGEVIGRTPLGRGTVSLLRMNEGTRVRLRLLLRKLGEE